MYVCMYGSLQHIVLAKRKSVKRKGEDHHACLLYESRR